MFITTADNTIKLSYNSSGMRTQKTVDDVDTNYYYDSDNNLVGMTANGKTMLFYYDADGSVTSFKYNGDMYYYVKSLQGDIVKIINQSGTVYASYVYDAWGNIQSETGEPIVRRLNPFRYRGYVYDEETGLYYLQSRYYDPETGRFLNADVYCDTETGSPLSTNMFVYCENDPINKLDEDGYKSIDITQRLKKLMLKNAKYLYTLAKACKLLGFIGKTILLAKFYKLVKTNGKWDLKNKKSWKISKKDQYVFCGIKVSVADIGNIHFGFVGSVLFSWRTLCTGAGLYQIYSGTSSWKFWYSFFDDPRDTYCISLGRVAWRLLYRKWVFQW